MQPFGKDPFPLQNRTGHVAVCLLEESTALEPSVSAPGKGFGSVVDMCRLNSFLTFSLHRFSSPMAIFIDSTGWLFGGFFWSSLGSKVQTHQFQFCCDIAYIYNYVEFVFAGIGLNY